MNSFTEEEFKIMIEQLLDKKRASFDMLCTIADKTLSLSVKRWCANDRILRGGQHEDDIMQEIRIRLILTCKSYFLLRNGVDGPVNNDPEGFKNWMFTVALNVKRDYAKKLRRLYGRLTEINENTTDTDDGLLRISESRIELLSAAFSIVIDSDSGIYKILTWIAQCLFMLELDVTKIQSNYKILEAFETASLGEMYLKILASSHNIPWLVISDEQKKKIECKLAKPWDGSRCFRDVEYREFFMKTGGKKSISDWVNRMNDLIKREIKHDASDS